MICILRAATPLLFLLAPPVIAQEVPYPGAPIHTLELPIAGSGPFGEAALCSFDGDETQDLVLIRGGRLRLVTAPGLAPFELVAAGNYTHFDIFAEAGPGGADALIACGGGGVDLLTWDESILGFNISTITSHPAWRDCLEIKLRATAGPAEVALLMADARTVGFASAPGWEASPWSIVSPFAPVLDLEMLDFDGDGDQEIALLGYGRVDIWTFGGSGWSLTAGFPLSMGTGRALSVGHSGTDDWLACLIDRVGGQDVAILMRGEVYGLHAIGDRDISTLASGAWNNDAHSDLFAGWRSRREFGVFQDAQDQQPSWSTPQFSDLDTATWSGLCEPTADVVVIPSSTSNLPAPTTLAEPAPGDVDDDGDCDLAYAVEDEGQVLIALNACTDHELFKPRLEQFDQSTPPEITLAPVEGLLHLQFRLNTNFQPAGSNALEVLLFRREVDVPGDDVYDTVPVSIAGNLFQFTGGSAPSSVDVDLLLTDPNGHPIPATETTLDDDMFFWVQRFVHADPSGVVLRAFPSEVAGFQASCDWSRAGCDAGVAQRTRMLGWKGTGAIDVLLEPADGVVIGNGLVFPCLPDLSGPLRRGAANYLVLSSP